MVDYFNSGLLCHSFLTIQSTMKLPSIGCALFLQQHQQLLQQHWALEHREVTLQSKISKIQKWAQSCYVSRLETSRIAMGLF